MRWWWLVVALAAVLPGAAWADSKAEARRYFARGMAAIEAGRFRDGIRDLEQAYAIRPHRNVRFNIARAYAALGELTPAIENFERYLETEPPDAEQVKATVEDLRVRRDLRRLVDRAMAAIAAGRPLEGVEDLRRAYRIRPHPDLLFNIGRAYEEAGELPAALEAFRGYLASRPADGAEVERRVKRLQGAARPKEARPPPEDRRRRPAPTPSEPDSGQIERIAADVAERVAADVAGRIAAQVAERVEAALERSAYAAPLPEVAALADTATAAPPAAELEAKTDEAYREVVVTASRRAQSPLEAPNAVTILTEEDIRLSGARTLPELLRRVPGMDVMAMSYSDHNVAVRGFNRRLANKVLVLVDNRTVYLDFLGWTSWRTLPVELADIDRIEVVRGPGSAVYGAYAYTGIIHIITKRPEQLRGVVAEVAAGNGETVEASFQYGSRSGPVGVRFSGGYQRGQKYEIDFDASRPDVSTELEDPALSLELARATGVVEWHLPGGAGHAYLGGSLVHARQEFFGVANLRNIFAEGPEMHARAGFESELFTLRAFFARVEKSTQNQSFPTGLGPLPSQVRNDVVSVEPIFKPSFELGGTHNLVLGGEYRFKAIQWNFLGDFFGADPTENHFAAYFQDEWTPDDSVRVVASGRLDLHPLIGPLGSPRLALIFAPAAGQALRVSAGTAFRVPTMGETYLSLSAPLPQVPGAAVTLVGGGDRLRPEEIATLDVGYRVETDTAHLEAVGYLNRVTNLIVRSPLSPSDGRQLASIDAFEIARSVYENESRAYLAGGAELSARLFLFDGVDIGANYAFQYIADEATGERFTDSPLHKVSVFSQIRTNLGVDLGVSVHYVSDQQWVEPDFDPNSPTGFDGQRLPVDASVAVLARVGYRLAKGGLELALSGYNLLDVGRVRRREHPFANRLESRVVGSLVGRF